MLKQYILVMRDVGYHLIGPFDKDEDAQLWAMLQWDQAKGDPRWQILGMTTQPAKDLPSVYAPLQAQLLKQQGQDII